MNNWRTVSFHKARKHKMPYWQTELDWTDSDPHNSRRVGQPPRQPFHFTPTHRSQSRKSEIMVLKCITKSQDINISVYKHWDSTILLGDKL